MSVFHSPGCRIKWTQIVQGNSAVNVINGAQYFQLTFGVSLDTAIWQRAGIIRANWDIFENEVLVTSEFSGGWIPKALPPLAPGASGQRDVWYTFFWATASRATNGRRNEIFLFRPRVQLWLGIPGGARVPGEFAIAEEDHYFLME